MQRLNQRGQSLVEYVLPISLILVGAGVLASTTNITDSLDDWVASGMGGTVSGGAVQSSAMGAGTPASVQTGSGYTPTGGVYTGSNVGNYTGTAFPPVDAGGANGGTAYVAPDCQNAATCQTYATGAGSAQAIAVLTAGLPTTTEPTTLLP
ncbi:MAG: hypothetical protein AB7P76_08340 [Candidatus Melainabacteria bacterium]